MLVTTPPPVNSLSVQLCKSRSILGKAYWPGIRQRHSITAASHTQQPSAPAQPAADGMQRAAGPSCGMLPNIHVRSISIETLRGDPHFAALPPVDDLVLSHPQSYRYVRQDSPMWRALHAGVLTSSTLNGALGVHEPSAVAQLGLPKHFVSHGKLLAAAANLCQPQHVPPPPVPLPSLAEAHQLNRDAVAAHNTPSQATLPPQPASQHAVGQRSGAGSRRKRGKGAVQHAASDARRRATAVALAERGPGSVRMAWGSAQEAASVHALLQVFPNADVGEVGLCMVDREALPAEWGVRPELLPPMGASPDAMLHHRAVPPALASDPGMSAAAPAAQPAAGFAAQGGAAAAAMPTSAAAGAFTAGQRVANSGAVSRGFQQPLGLTAASAAMPGVRTSAAWAPALPVNDAARWGNGPAPGGRALQPADLPTERGLRLCSELESELRASKVTHQPQPRPMTQPAGQPTTLAADIEALLQRLQLSTQQKQRPAAIASASAPAAEAPDPGRVPGVLGAGAVAAQQHLQLPLQAAGASPVQGAEEAEARLEMVEVKNTCPFASKPQLSRKGKQRMQYMLADKGPRMQVPAYWVAQLQMEMLASGTHSIILLSRSATKGSNVFRMQRDDTFLRLMLCCIQQLMETYVLPGVQPPPNSFARDLQHQQLYSRILHIVASTPVLSHVPYVTPHPAATDARYFLD